MNWLLNWAYRLYALQWRVTRPITLGVRILLIQDHQVLLVRHTYQAEWHFPGGGLKRGETVAEAVRREAREEVGAHLLEPPQLLGLYTAYHSGKSDHIATFVCHDFVLHTPTDRWEIHQCRPFPLDALPADLSPGSARRIRDYLQGNWPYAGRW